MTENRADGSGAGVETGRRIAVPVAEGVVAEHFGHCEEFAIFHTDPACTRIDGVVMVPAPPHQPGLLPVWLQGLGVNVVIAGGMGQRARDLFEEHSIDVVIGSGGGSAREVAQAYLEGTLEPGANPCDH